MGSGVSTVVWTNDGLFIFYIFYFVGNDQKLFTIYYKNIILVFFFILPFKNWGQAGIEPATSRTLNVNHTTRPLAHIIFNP